MRVLILVLLSLWPVFPAAVPPMVVTSIADLKALPPGITGSVELQGYYAAGDGGGGPLYWDGTSTSAPDSCTCYRPSNNPTRGRWLRKYSGLINARWCGAKGDGSNAQAALQAAINTLPTGTVYIPNGTYMLVAKLTTKSNVWLVGESLNAILTGVQLGNRITDPDTNQNYPYIDINGVSNVRVKNLKIDGQGVWTTTPFVNPYSSSSQLSVGFTNHDAAVRVRGNAKDIEVSGCEFTGLSLGVYCYGDSTTQNLNVLNNYMHNLGAGNRIQKVQGFEVSGNRIDSVMGNMTPIANTDTAYSMFADPVYIERSTGGTVSGNFISYFIRIGIVLEGASSGPDTIIKNTLITIAENSIKRGTRCRGTEFNAGIWSEGNRSAQPITVSNNVIDSMGQNSVNGGIGILAHEVTVTGGSIKNCTLGGISGGGAMISGVRIEACKYGADVANGSTSQTMTFSNCIFEGNTLGGLSIEHGVGYYQIIGNMFRDNGTSALTGIPTTGFGIRINGYESGQHIFIQENTFVSGVNQADNHATIPGQFYGIMGVAGGASRNQDWIANNTFLYTGTLSAYPANVAAAPCAYAYDLGGGSPTLYDFMGYNGNLTSKFPAQTNMEITQVAGIPRFLGFANSLPVGVDYRRGDWYYNTNQAANQGMIYLCTRSGVHASPDTNAVWEERLWGNIITSGGLDVTGTIHARAGRIVLEGTNLFQAYGVGTDTSANSESLDWFHNGAGVGGGVIRVTKTGSGSYRMLTLQTGGANTLELATNQDVTVSAGNLSIGGGTKGVIYAAGPKDLSNSGSPEGAVIAPIGSTYRRNDGGAGSSLYIKESGSGNTGWVPVGTTSGTFSFALGGCTTAPTGTARYTVYGNVVTLTFPALTGTSNTTSLTYTGLPAALQPANIQYFTIPSLVDNGAFVTLKTDVSVTSSGTVTFQIGDSASGFTNSGTKGVGHQFTITYQLQ